MSECVSIVVPHSSSGIVGQVDAEIVHYCAVCFFVVVICESSDISFTVWYLVLYSGLIYYSLSHSLTLKNEEAKSRFKVQPGRWWQR